MQHSEQADSTSETATPAQLRNRRPVLKTAILASAFFVGMAILAGVLGLSRPQAPRALGQLLADLFPGFIALGVWATRADSRWGIFGWAWRLAFCLVVSGLLMALLAAFGRTGPAQL
jgi:hypothetical protein